MKYISQKYDGYEFNFNAVNVLLGANGAGKSTFLAELRQHLQQQGRNNFVYAEGGRTITIKDILQLDNRNFQAYDRLEQAMAQYESKRKSSLANRVFDALIVLDKKGQEQKTKRLNGQAQ